MPKESGKSIKLDNLIQEVIAGNHNKRKLLEDYGATYCRVYRGISHCIDLVKKPKIYVRKEPPQNIVWFGKAGCGKTYEAENVAIDGEKSMFKLPMRQLKQGWYDGYQGEEIILFDDFRGASMEPHEFLNLLDGLDRLPVKGGYIENESKLLFFTSSDHPINWWPKWYAKDDNNWAQVKRRLNQVWLNTKNDGEYATHATDLDDVSMYKTEPEVIVPYKPTFTDKR